MTDLPNGQHEWEATFGHDDIGRPVPPSHHNLVFLEVAETPGAHARRLLESRLAELERRFAFGPDGFLSTLGWGPAWWNEYTDVNPGIIIPSRMSRFEEPVLENPHAILHVASNHGEILDEIREALFGDNGVAQYLKVREVRRGFVGAGLPAGALPDLGIPASSPLLLGFHSVLRGNQATEESVTIAEGPLAGGTTAHVSRIVLDVERWHRQSRDEQAALLFGPTVTAAEAESLSDDAPSGYPTYEQEVARHGVVGHAQAAARARVDNVPIINRRDFATLDDGQPGTHFVAIQKRLVDFNATRAIMNGADGSRYHGAVAARRRNGINAFMDVTRRAAVGIPPRALRAFPFLRS